MRFSSGIKQEGNIFRFDINLDTGAVKISFFYIIT